MIPLYTQKYISSISKKGETTKTERVARSRINACYGNTLVAGTRSSNSIVGIKLLPSLPASANFFLPNNIPQLLARFPKVLEPGNRGTMIMVPCEELNAREETLGGWALGCRPLSTMVIRV